MAARYLMVGEHTLRTIVHRAGVQPVDLGVSVTRWRRSDLDALIDKLPYRGDFEDSCTVSTNQPDPKAAALDRVKRRLRK